MEPFIGEIRMVGFNFAPINWAKCDGSIIAISQNSALFSLLGTQFGGNGTQTFALPDLRGRVPVHQGAHSGGQNYSMGQTGGVEQVQLNVQHMPAHNHTVQGTAQGQVSVAIPATSSDGDTSTPASDKVLAKISKGLNTFNGYSSAAADTTLKPFSAPAEVPLNAMTSAVGSSAPFSTLQPFQVVNFIIAMQGIYPQRQ